MGIPTHKSSLLLRACYQPLRDEPICGAGIGMEETGNERKKEKQEAGCVQTLRPFPIQPHFSPPRLCSASEMRGRPAGLHHTPVTHSQTNTNTHTQRHKTQ